MSIVSLPDDNTDDSPEPQDDKLTVSSLMDENHQLRKQVADLKRQVIYSEQVSAEKERTIKLLQNQMALYYTPTCSPNPTKETNDKHIQTDKQVSTNTLQDVLDLPSFL